MKFSEIILKHSENGCFGIFDGTRGQIAKVELIQAEDTDNDLLLTKMTEWRSIHSECFLSVFKPTIERTKQWLQNSIVQSDDRVLFKIFANDGQLVGHIGAIRNKEYIEYDYFIMGIKVGIKNFSLIVAKRFLHWIGDVSRIDVIKGRVRSDNVHAIDFHIKTGFTINGKLPLRKQKKTDQEYILVPESVSYLSDIFLLEIRLNRKEIKF